MSQRKLLLADDSITIQKVVNLTFADEGIEVVTVGDGDAAMERIAEFKPDLIMADVNMPGLNGYQICEKIKQSEDLNKTPVILLVGSFEPFDEAEARRVGADDFLTKPFQSIRQLVNKVTELLDANKTGAALRENHETENSAAVSENSLSESIPKANQFGDAGLDDEMIQTNQPGGFALDELQKFETRTDPEPAADAGKIQPLSALELQQFSFSAPEENIVSPDESSEIQNPSQSSFKSTETIPEAVFSHPTTALEFEDDFFLELPPDEETEDEPESSPSVVTNAEPAESISTSEETDNETETDNQAASAAANLPEQNEVVSESENFLRQSQLPDDSERNQNAVSPAASSQLSPETIDVIVQKVVERLSDKAVREIAWEVVPQLADLIVRKMAEENMKK